jgi:hypothetical protein
LQRIAHPEPETCEESIENNRLDSLLPDSGIVAAGEKENDSSYNGAEIPMRPIEKFNLTEPKQLIDGGGRAA